MSARYFVAILLTAFACAALSAADEAPKLGYEQRLDAMMEAVGKGQLSRLRELLKEGGDVNDKTESQETLLMRAAARGQVSIVYFLLGQGATVTERDQKGQTALMHAAEQGHLDILQALLNPREHVPNKDDKVVWKRMTVANVSTRDSDGRTALMRGEQGTHRDRAGPDRAHARYQRLGA